MISLFNTALSSPVLIILTIIFGITASVVVFDKRLIQAKKVGVIPKEEPILPKWVAGIYWIYLISLWLILIFNWKYGIAIYILKFIFSVIPVLETIGNVLMAPFKPKH